ncbi:MAG: dicarboxylate/amino acid:cation symporter [Labilithrix sp.]|nr:dicarboxylate/amino acid:cation symporter [Labilithrix sp.]MCW5816096.1 dicarboxylate/amino acid:cation symporter [Labilithrix sp.]
MGEAEAEKKSRFPLVARLLVAIVLGALVGTVLGARAAVLGEVGILVIKLLKALATPLVFLAIVDSFCRAKIPAKKGAILIAICVLNAAVAGLLSIGLSAAISPGTRTDVEAFEKAMTSNVAAKPAAAATSAATSTAPKMDPVAALTELVPDSIARPFVENQVLTIVLFAVMCGIALRKMRNAGKGGAIFRLVEETFALTATLLHGIVAVVPVAVFCVVAKVVGTTGFSIFLSLGALVGTVTLGLLIHVLGWYTLLVTVVARRSPIAFFRAASQALMTAFGTGSSMATLPVTLRTLEKDLKVGHDSARLAACVGTNFNNDGIMLYEVVAALFIAQINGIALDGGDKAKLAVTSAIAAAGIAGVPEAGLITLSLVLSSVGLPLASLPVLLTVDWLLGRFRAMTNVSSDLLVATLLDALGGKTTEPAEVEADAPPASSISS